MGICDLPVISGVCETAGEAAASLVSAPFDWLAQAMGSAAGWLFEAVWNVFDATTLVDITSDGYLSVYNLLFGIAVLVMLLFFCLQLITGLIRRDPTALTRAALGLAKSVLGSFVVITLTGLLLEVVDQLCVGIVQAAGETTESMGEKITILAGGLTAINIAAPGVGAIITIFLAGLAITSAAIVWLSLLVRKALLLVAIVFAPLALSGSSWDATRGWISKWAMFVVALICSKLVLVVMFLVAITQVAAPINGDLSSISDPLAGVVLMAMAAFAPYLTYRFISFVGFDMYHAIGAEQDAKNSLNRPIPLPDRQPGNPQQVLDGNNSSSGDSNGGGGKQPAKPSTPNPSASQGSAEAGAGTGGAAGSGASGSGAASGGSAAAAGPAAAAVVGVQVAKDAATAGPKAGAEVGQQAETAADAADHTPANNEGGGNGGNTPPAPVPGETPPQQGTPPASGEPTPPSTPSSQPPGSSSPGAGEQVAPSAPVPNPPPADNPPPPSSAGKEPQS
ncbi:MAG: conjugal transfer protein TrbL [Cutibacterium avidum]|uniref:conjugal transfer protein TrbL n=1 Tax=Actinomyces urogenitalis TaxID=103621 RepID=UPI000660F186|nr:conjugal transfer protein TrbL [Actinomyces urogenitalis]MBS5744311.1 conjugal transfer protein TrbL [Propionibacterium sp.]MDU2372226.1 conjugal transfer protein TrbL [Cutibacterium avidum]MBS5977552.1 conjugal transfer protein TrbL [Actinomyces urogenitalis]MBS6072406.1 conjugal transfer protein TrbL [Actinomyces urogenitalis]MDU3942529.1 conjugal transfer protein TrbL [Cutibacterium avidum]